MVITLGAWAAVASVLSRREEAAELQRMRKEVLREQEYKEVAVYTIHTYIYTCIHG